MNVNRTILDLYVRDVVPRITKTTTHALAAARSTVSSGETVELDDDGNYGSAATLDVELLQALSKRIHFGKFVSESKFRSSPSSFIKPILEGNREKLGEMITKKDVELRLLGRVRKKARMYGQEVDADGNPIKALDRLGDDDRRIEKIDVESVVELYEKHIIPLTKEVEVSH